MTAQQGVLNALTDLKNALKQEQLEQAQQAQAAFNSLVKNYCDAGADAQFLASVLEQYQQLIQQAQAQQERLGKELRERRQSAKSIAAYKKHR